MSPSFCCGHSRRNVLHEWPVLCRMPDALAVAMDAPRHQKLKELSEGIVEMYRVDPSLTGPLMEMVQMMLGVV